MQIAPWEEVAIDLIEPWNVKVNNQKLCWKCRDMTCLLRLLISCCVVTCHDISWHVTNIATYKAFVSQKIGDIYVSRQHVAGRRHVTDIYIIDKRLNSTH
jgi:hypothetical protein